MTNDTLVLILSDCTNYSFDYNTYGEGTPHHIDNWRQQYKNFSFMTYKIMHLPVMTICIQFYTAVSL